MNAPPFAEPIRKARWRPRPPQYPPRAGRQGYMAPGGPKEMQEGTRRALGACLCGGPKSRKTWEPYSTRDVRTLKRHLSVLTGVINAAEKVRLLPLAAWQERRKKLPTWEQCTRRHRAWAAVVAKAKKKGSAQFAPGACLFPGGRTTKRMPPGAYARSAGQENNVERTRRIG
jgi:hypothetical protein